MVSQNVEQHQGLSAIGCNQRKAKTVEVVGGEGFEPPAFWV